MAQTITQLTLAWLIATIEATRAGLAGNLAQTPVADWGADPVREVRNHEQDLHTAMQVLGDMLNVRGAFAASGIPAAPHLEQVPVYVCGVDLSGASLVDLKKVLADPHRHEWRTCIERMPALTVQAPAATVRQPLTDERIEPLFRARQQMQVVGEKDEWFWFAWGVADAERAHGITAAAPQAPAAPAEAQRLAQFLQDRQTCLGPSRASAGKYNQESWDDYERAWTMLLGMAAPAAPVGWVTVPRKITDSMIEAALAAHYGKKRLAAAGGAGGIDMTVDDTNYSGADAMRRMWCGALAAIREGATA
jgi:hypothetical protein